MSEGGLLLVGSAGESVPGPPPAAGVVAAPWLVAASLLSLSPSSRGLPPVCLCPDFPLGFPVAQTVKNLPAVQETGVLSLG